MKQIKILLIFLCAASLSCDHTCINATSDIAFVNFPANETETVIVRQFKKATDFAELLDSFVLSSEMNRYYQSNDTLRIVTIHGMDNGLLSKYDYEFFLPETGSTYRITDIAEDYLSDNLGCSTTKVACVNTIRSYKVNGELKPGDNLYSLFYITR